MSKEVTDWYRPGIINLFRGAGDLDQICSPCGPHEIKYTNRRMITYVYKKVKCTLVQALRLCTGRTAYRRSRGIALPFNDHGTRWGWEISVTPRLLSTPGKDPAPIVQEAGWAPGPVWTVAENLVPTGIRSPDRPAPSQSLYRLRYPARTYVYNYLYNFTSVFLYTSRAIKNKNTLIITGRN